MAKRIIKAKVIEQPRSLMRMFFWEALGVAGFIYILLHPVANSLWDLGFFYSALFFLAAYPLLYIYRWKLAGGFLDILLLPTSFVLSLGLGVSAYLWITYWLYITGNPYAHSLMNHYYVMGPLFIFIYFPFIQPFWGVTRYYYSLPGLVILMFYSGLCGFIGYLLGSFVDHKFGASLGSENTRFVLWLSLIFIGIAIGALSTQRKAKD